MGDSRSAVADDEDSWYRLKENAGISQIRYDVYSPEAGYAKEGYRLGFTGKLLESYIGHRQKLVELDRTKRDLVEKWDAFIKSYNEFIKS